jgi:hypothetical protein
VRIGRVKYLACQPWPFLQFDDGRREALTEEITVDPESWPRRAGSSARNPRDGRAVPRLPDDLTQVSVRRRRIAHQICRRGSNRPDSL